LEKLRVLLHKLVFKYRADTRFVLYKERNQPTYMTWTVDKYFYFWQHAKARLYCYDGFHGDPLKNRRRLMNTRTGFAEMLLEE